MKSSKILFFSVCEDGGDSWKYSYRPCCEALFLTLFHENRVVLAPMLVSLVKESSGPVSPHDLRALLHKDAVYNAVGLAAFDLYDDIDFDQWLVHGIEQEMAIKDSNYRIGKYTQCGNFIHLLSLRFYVKSSLKILEVQNQPFNAFKGSEF